MTARTAAHGLQRLLRAVVATLMPTLVAAIKIHEWHALGRGAGTCCAPRDYWRGGGPPKE